MDNWLLIIVGTIFLICIAFGSQRSRKIYYNEHYDRMHGGNSGGSAD